MYIGLVLVGVIWGVTNPLMEKGSASESTQEFDISLKFFMSVFSRIGFVMAFIVN